MRGKVAAIKNFQYKAFISYSHADGKAAAWMQKALESYRIPRRSGKSDKSDKSDGKNRKLGAVFRDREELSAGGNLADNISRALANSEYLIVVCSPAAAQSKWVNLEIEQFRKTRTDDKILCLLVAGEPFSNIDNEECFPKALGYHQGATENVQGATEPIAADIRASGDGKRQALLKIVAGILDVGLDKLVQRDTQRRHRRILAFSVASAIGMVAMTALALFALEARKNEVLRRAEAEELIEFMLSDLRNRLDSVGRLDVLNAVGQEAVSYYSKVALNEHTDASLGRRARAFHILGEVDDLSGNLAGAREDFREANTTTGELLLRAPMNGERIYNHAQSVFWVGYLEWRMGDYDRAEAAFDEYVRLAYRLQELDKPTLIWMAELGHAKANLGVFKLETESAAVALEYFQEARLLWYDVVNSEPENIEFLWQAAQSDAWLADTHEALGDFNQARDSRANESLVYKKILVKDQGNRKFQQALSTSFHARAHISLSQGLVSQALGEAERAQHYNELVLQADPNNTLTMSNQASILCTLAMTHGYREDFDMQSAHLDEAQAVAEQLLSFDPNVLEWQLRSKNITIQRGTYHLEKNDPLAALREVEKLIIEAETLSSDLPQSVQLQYLLAEAHAIASEAYYHLGRDKNHKQQATLVAYKLTALEQDLPPRMLALLAHSYTQTGKENQAAKIQRKLESIGFNHPGYFQNLRIQ